MDVSHCIGSSSGSSRPRLDAMVNWIVVCVGLLYVTVRGTYNMGIDLCQGWGDEHEAPCGAKCKVVKVKVARRPVKTEQLDADDQHGTSVGVEDAVDKMLGLSVAGSKDSKSSVSKLIVVLEVEPDEGELELRRLLEKRVLEKRKATLRAALEKDSSSDEEKEDRRSRKKRKEKKKKKKSKSKRRKRGKEDAAGRDESSSPGGSSSSSSSSTDSSDSDSSRDRSRERTKRRRRKRSKFSLDKYTTGRKNVNNLTFIELIYPGCVWGSKRPKNVDMDIADLMGYLGQLASMCMHGTTNNYSDEACRGYDQAIREKAQDKGLRAFKMGDYRLSLLHFNMDNSKSYKEGRKPSHNDVPDFIRNMCWESDTTQLLSSSYN